MSHDVFISYSSHDKPTADAACATLEARGIRCWVAPRDILPGMDWSESIIDAIVGCRLMILILSSHSNLSEQVKREVTTAVGEAKILIPLRVEDVPLSKHMRYFLSTPHWLDAWTPPLERHLQVLTDTVQRFLAVPSNKQTSATASTAPTVPTAPREPEPALAEPQTPCKAESKPAKDIFDATDFEVGALDSDDTKRKGEKDIFDNADSEVDALNSDRDSDDRMMNLDAQIDFGLFDADVGSEVFAIDEEDVDPGARTEHRGEPTVPDVRPKLITNSIGMKLTLIPAGEFLMGSPDSDQAALDDEKPQHRVRITRPFYLGVYPVTQGQYRAVTGENPSYFKGSDDLPVEQVSWDDAVAFCNELSVREGLNASYQAGAVAQSWGEGYRLPTEAEWEYACRAGSTTRYSFGDDAASLGEYAWFKGNSGGKWFKANRGGKTHPAGQKRANAFGLFDMHGNVWEWCWDSYIAAYYACSPGVDPDGPSQAEGRVVRGGGWNYDPRLAWSAYRERLTPADRSNDVGFRVARVQSGR